MEKKPAGSGSQRTHPHFWSISLISSNSAFHRPAHTEWVGGVNRGFSALFDRVDLKQQRVHGAFSGQEEQNVWFLPPSGRLTTVQSVLHLPAWIMDEPSNLSMWGELRFYMLLSHPHCGFDKVMVIWTASKLRRCQNDPPLMASPWSAPPRWKSLAEAPLKRLGRGFHDEQLLRRGFIPMSRDVGTAGQTSRKTEFMRKSDTNSQMCGLKLEPIPVPVGQMQVTPWMVHPSIAGPINPHCFQMFSVPHHEAATSIRFPSSLAFE